MTDSLSSRPAMPRLTGHKGRYLRNCWYVAGWADELVDTPQARVFLDEPVALFRDAEGVAHAIGGRCPHRFAALGNGVVTDGQLQCPYHGLRFDGSGACAHNPHEHGVVPRVAVPRYPLAEQHALLWIWMGEEAQADTALIPDFSWLSNPRWEAVRGTALAEGHYELYSDNIMDLGHANFVHPALVSNAFTTGPRRFWQEGEQVWSEYAQNDDYLSDGISMMLGTQGRKQDFYGAVRWDAPAVMYFDFRAGEPGTPRDEMTSLPSLHAFTPETEGTTHYFWATARDFALGDDGFSAAMRGALENAFEQEDMPVIRDAHRLMEGADFWSLRPVVLTGDAGGVRCRRTLEKRIKREEAAMSIAAE